MNISLDRMLGIAGSCGKAWEIDAMSDKEQLCLHVSLSAHSQSRPQLYCFRRVCHSSERLRVDYHFIFLDNLVLSTVLIM